LFNSQFIKNTLTLSSGTFFSQVVLFILTPILSRIYHPETFGLLAIYLTIIAIFWNISSGKYELAIVLPKSSKEAINLLALSFILNIFFFIFSSILIIIATSYISIELNPILILVPFGIFLESMIYSINQFNIRNNKYNFIAYIKILRSLYICLIQMILYYLGIINLGLIWGVVIAGSLILLLLFFDFRSVFLDFKKSISMDSLTRTAIKYIRFPKFQSISSLLNAVSQSIPILLITPLFGTLIVGYYSMAQRFLKLPITLISDSIRQVFYKHGADLLNKDQDILPLYKKTTLSLFSISTPCVIISWFILPDLFGFLLGEHWIIAGEYSQIIIFWLYLAFINPPSVASIQLLGLQDKFFYYELLLLLARVFSILIGYKYYGDVLISLKLFTLVSVLFNILLIIFIYCKIKSRPINDKQN